MTNKICGIYCIENKSNNKKYVGQSINIAKRFKDHERRIKSKDYKRENQLLIDSWYKYGKENFVFYVLEECAEKELDEKEIFYIEKFNSICPNGYNFSKGGIGGLKGFKHSEESKSNMSKGRLGIIFSEEHKKNIALAKIGIKPSAESKEKRSLSLLGEKCYKFGKKNKNTTSKYLGVSLWKSEKYAYWVSRITVNGEVVRIGNFKIEEDAAKAYDDFIIKNNLSNPLNFPENYN